MANYIPTPPAHGTTGWDSYVISADSALDTALQKVSARIFHVSNYGAVWDGTTDDTAAVAATITAAAGAGTVVLPSGAGKITSRLTVPAGVNLIGSGNGFQAPGTRIICATSSAAGITFTGYGGVSGGFLIDGASVANQPLIRSGATAQRTFLALDVVSGLQDNITILASQNDTWISCNEQLAGRDGLVIDQGAGGMAFYRCEFNKATRYGHRFDVAITGGPYTQPTHIVFNHCIVESQGVTGNSKIYNNGGLLITYRDCVVQGSGLSGPLIDVLGAAYLMTWDAGQIIGSVTSDTGIRIASGCEITLTGRPEFLNLLNGINLPSGSPVVGISSRLFFSNVTNYYAGGANADVCVRATFNNALSLTRTASSDTAVISEAPSGHYWWDEASGKRHYGSGSDYTGDLTLYRSAPATLTTDGDFTISTVGKGLRVKEGVNTKQGTATLSGGVSVVGNTAVTANSRILLTSNVDGGTPGWLRVSARNPGTSFTITSSSSTDSSVVAYQIFEPA